MATVDRLKEYCYCHREMYNVYTWVFSPLKLKKLADFVKYRDQIREINRLIRKFGQNVEEFRNILTIAKNNPGPRGSFLLELGKMYIRLIADIKLVIEKVSYVLDAEIDRKIVVIKKTMETLDPSVKEIKTLLEMVYNQLTPDQIDTMKGHAMEEYQTIQYICTERAAIRQNMIKTKDLRDYLIGGDMQEQPQQPDLVLLRAEATIIPPANLWHVHNMSTILNFYDTDKWEKKNWTDIKIKYYRLEWAHKYKKHNYTNPFRQMMDDFKIKYRDFRNHIGFYYTLSRLSSGGTSSPDQNSSD